MVQTIKPTGLRLLNEAKYHGKVKVSFYDHSLRREKQRQRNVRRHKSVRMKDTFWTNQTNKKYENPLALNFQFHIAAQLVRCSTLINFNNG